MRPHPLTGPAEADAARRSVSARDAPRPRTRDDRVAARGARRAPYAPRAPRSVRCTRARHRRPAASRTAPDRRATRDARGSQRTPSWAVVHVRHGHPDVRRRCRTRRRCRSPRLRVDLPKRRAVPCRTVPTSHGTPSRLARTRGQRRDAWSSRTSRSVTRPARNTSPKPVQCSPTSSQPTTPPPRPRTQAMNAERTQLCRSGLPVTAQVTINPHITTATQTPTSDTPNRRSVVITRRTNRPGRPCQTD